MNNRIAINNNNLIYILFVILTVVLLNNEYRSVVSFFTFISVLIICLIVDRSIECVSLFVLLVLINTAVGKIGVIGTSVSVTSAMYIILLFLTLLLFYQGKKIGTKASLLILLWVITRVITHIINGLGIVNVLWSSVVVFIGIYYYLFVKDDPKKSAMFLKCLYFAGMLICFFGFVELIMGKTFFYSRWTGAERYRYGILRVGSLLEDPNCICLYLLPLIFLSHTSVVVNIIKKNVRNVFNILGVLLIFITGSRTAMLVLLITASFFVFLKYRKLFILILPLLAILFLVMQSSIPELIKSVLDADASSSSARMHLMNVAIDFWKENIIWGNGYNSFYDNSEMLVGNKFQIINTYLTMLVEFGIVGFLFYVILYFYEIKYIYKYIYKVNSRDGVFMILSLLSWIIMVLSLDTFSTALFWLFPAIIVAIKQLVEDNEYDGSYKRIRIYENL